MLRGITGWARLMALALGLSVVACAGPPPGRSLPSATATASIAAPAPTPAVTPATAGPSPSHGVLPTAVPVRSIPPATAAFATRLGLFSDRIRVATQAIARDVPEARRSDESFAAYGKRALATALERLGPTRDLVEGERRSLEGLSAEACPTAIRYKVLVNAYSVVVGAVWAAVYAPDPDLLEQGLADLDALNLSLASAQRRLKTAPDPCVVALDTDVAELASRVVGTQIGDILRGTDRLHESPMGDLVADAMRQSDPHADAALLNSGNLRADLLADPPSADEQPGEITWGELVAGLPFGDRIATLTVSGATLSAALRNGFGPACDPKFAGGTGRFPQLSGIAATFRCDGDQPVIKGLWRTDGGSDDSRTPIREAEKIRLVTVDYLVAGGDGYKLPESETDGTGATLLKVVMDYLEARSPVSPAVEGRIVGP